MAAELSLLAVHAHPDDEAIGTGGSIARYAAEGVRVTLACATRGEEGEIVVPDLDNDEVRANLGALRVKELQCACGILGVSDLVFLDYRDSGMMGTPENGHPESFWQANLAEATGRLVRVVRQVRPQVVLTYDPNGIYGHPDHIMTHRVAVAAFEAAGDPMAYPELGLEAWQPSKLYYVAYPRSFFLLAVEQFRQMGRPSPFADMEIDLDQFGTADEDITTHLDVRQFLKPKLDALACHRSQVDPKKLFFLDDSLVEPGMGHEYFTLARGQLGTSLPEDDLFAGLR